MTIRHQWPCLLLITHISPPVVVCSLSEPECSHILCVHRSAPFSRLMTTQYPPSMGVACSGSKHHFIKCCLRSRMVCYYSYHFHKLSVSLASLALAAPTYSLWHTMLRWFADRADNEYLAPPPIRSATITQCYGDIILMPFKESLLGQCLHIAHSRLPVLHSEYR